MKTPLGSFCTQLNHGCWFGTFFLLRAATLSTSIQTLSGEPLTLADTNQDNLTQKSTTTSAFIPRGSSVASKQAGELLFPPLKDICIPHQHFLPLCEPRVSREECPTLTESTEVVRKWRVLSLRPHFFGISPKFRIEIKKQKNKFLD